MRIKIRIYNPYDLDIIALTEAPNFSVANAMKQTLRYYAMGKRYLVEIPALTESLVNEQYVKGFYVELDDVEDAQAVEFIKQIPDGKRNAFMKNIFRASFEVAPVSLFIGPGGSEFVAKMISNPVYGRHPVQRDIVDAVHLAEGEVGVTLSDETPDISKMPKGSKPVTVKTASTPQEKLRDVTKKSYQNVRKKKEEQENMRRAAINGPIESADSKATKTSDDMDDLLDSIM